MTWITSQSKDIVVLSPHLDDAVWSMGGVLSSLGAMGHRITVLTLCCSEPHEETKRLLPEKQHQWRQFGSMFLRKTENQRALDVLQVEGKHLSFCDSAVDFDINSGKFSLQSAEQLFTPPYSYLEQRKKAFALGLAKQVGEQTILFAPDACGGHVDHLACHSAAKSLTVEQLYFYREFPYATNPETCSPEEHIQGLTLKADWYSWKEAAEKYRSQINCLFSSREEFVSSLAQFAAADSGAEISFSLSA
ncbi:MAG: PIG-L deacetylase family protein [Aestuariibacter sp.]